jgi:hypothetical protein
LKLSLNFKEPFHISSFFTYLACPRRYVFSILNRDEGPAFRSTKLVVGTALHSAIEKIHDERWFSKTDKFYDTLIRDCINDAEFDSRDSHIPINWNKYREDRIDEIVERFKPMLINYTKSKMNRECKILYNEVKLEYDINGYKFSGRIDQVRETKDGVIQLIDFKTGKSKLVTTWNLKLNYQLSSYAIALKQNFGLDVDEIGLYRFQDHEPYKRWTPFYRVRNTGTHHESYKSWDKKQICTVEEYEQIKTAEKIKLTNNPKVKPWKFKGKDRSVMYYRPGTEKGPGLYTVKISENMLTNLAKEIQRVCAAIKRREFFRNPYSCSDCAFKPPCEADLEMTTAKDYTQAVTGW